MARSSGGGGGEITRWFEDFHDGEVIEVGSLAISAEDIVAFAARWDPQPMHLDEAAGRASLAGGLFASGWHTASMLMRLVCDNLLAGSASQGSPGIESVRWKVPVRPGDRLSGRFTILGTRTSAKRPEIGFLRGRFDVANQHGAVVMTMETTLMMGRREIA